ncbi:choice-of-anchor I family protein [Actinotalea sp. AC32]|nr:choice-of-anchor I family protein [Actinotalea sp. AC32]
MRRRPTTAVTTTLAIVTTAVTAAAAPVPAAPPAGPGTTAEGGAITAAGGVVPEPVSLSADDAALSLRPLGSHATGAFDAASAEIVAFHAASRRLFTVNALAGAVDVIDARDVSAPRAEGRLVAARTRSADGSVIPDGAVANSVAVRADGLGVVAVEAPTKTDPGWLVLFDADDPEVRPLGAVRVGAQPDMVALDARGRTAVVANEGEPDDDFAVDPEGSVSVVSLPARPGVPAQDAVRTAGFGAYDDGSSVLRAGVRVFGPVVDPARPVSTNLEPEYVAIADGTAYVTLQEANALAVVDLAAAHVTDVLPLAPRDFGVDGFGLDPSDRDGVTAVRTVAGLRGLPMPDAVAAYSSRGATYLVTANEGDAREWGGYEEGVRVKDLGSDGVPPICDGSPLVGRAADADLGRLSVTTASGLRADGACYEELYAFGTRSFSVWDTQGRLVFDSGDALERVTAAAVPGFANSNHTESAGDGRSDDKGPEPEGVTVGEVRGRTYAFVGLERVGGVVVFDITVPQESRFVTYVNNRDFTVSVEDDGVASLAAAGDLGPEGLTFVPASASPTRTPLLAVANEVSGTTTLFAVEPLRGGQGAGGGAASGR